MEGKWRTISTACSEVKLEADFSDEMIDSRAEMYAEAFVAGLKVEAASAGLPDGSIGMFIISMKPLVGTLLEWLN